MWCWPPAAVQHLSCGCVSCVSWRLAQPQQQDMPAAGQILLQPAAAAVSLRATLQQQQRRLLSPQQQRNSQHKQLGKLQAGSRQSLLLLG
jgi:hypothetical protein